MRRKLFFGLFGASLVSLVNLVGVSVTTASANQSATGWVYFPTPSVAGAQIETVQGTSTPGGGCALQASGESPGGSASQEWDEIGINTASCEIQYQVSSSSGSISTAVSDPPSSASSATKSGSDINTSKSSNGSSGTAGSLTSASSVTYSDYQKNWWIDPAGISVTAFQQWTKATFVNGCFSSGSWSINSQWIPDGWGLNHQNATATYNCGGYSQWGYSILENNLFCVGEPPAWNHYGQTYPNSNLLGVYYNGTHVWNYNDNSYGDSCAYLLSHRHDNT